MNRDLEAQSQTLHIKTLEKDIRKLTNISIALSKEKDRNKLLEMILIEAKTLSNADGGTLYMKENNNEISFEIVMTDSLNIHMGGSSKEKVTFPNLKLHDDNGNPNITQIAPYVALTGEIINIPDAYKAEGFDFSGTRAFDKMTNYRSKSFLTLPLRNHEDEIIGVLQLINARDDISNEIIPFNPHSESIVSALASQAAITLTNKNLVQDLRTLFESFIKVIAGAIDKKSPYTGGHCQRVPVLTMAIADAVNKTDNGIYKDINLNNEELYELHIASWLHDAGKVTIPEYVVDKATKLETIHDRITQVEYRFEVLKRDAEITFLKSKQSNSDKKAFEEKIRKIDDDITFLKKTNIGSEFMSQDLIDRVVKISQMKWIHNGQEQPLLTDDEVKNLTITHGTLTKEERDVINSHVSVTIEMLKELPYPKNLKNVPEIAGGHHEKMDGTGYPNGLKRDEMSLGARMMAIADIFEALTAYDRPYKKGKSLSEAMRILASMRDKNHIDPDLFDIFVNQELYMDYARKFLEPNQIDKVIKDDYIRL
ncbi:GAF domain-containing protein [Thiospirochaeta perfilievii]|uniref:GAF domain-containing protein n=1 Tax=Thiospirochaeta perfilievii TaxID=252967 RepID=A0A5C1QDX6_9SPIO|nr:HD domain-containing phosphohydrolase [Thiospirochaeta perfilievii]QEN04924.1 GAF domain-containing protein [Thiospirochaeta perfilievii]